MIGTAFGCSIALQNFGMFLSPLIAGETLETKKDNGYYWSIWYFSACALVCTLINIWVYIDDKSLRGGALTMVDVPLVSTGEIDRETFLGRGNSREQSRDLIAEGIHNAKHSAPLEGSFGG